MSLLEGAKVVFIVAGLGRATGSGLAPVVAELAKENGADTVSIAMMPFGFEEKLRFYAGLALRTAQGGLEGSGGGGQRLAPEEHERTPR